MNNAQIIYNMRFELMEAGTIGTTGRKIRVLWTGDDGAEEVREVMEPEEIHTFQDWKTRGYIVRKGEKARARFNIWNYTTKGKKGAEAAPEADPEAAPAGHYYMKNACFFAASQVEKLDDLEKDPEEIPEPVPERIPEAIPAEVEKDPAGVLETAAEILAAIPEKLLPVIYDGPMLPALV